MSEDDNPIFPRSDDVEKETKEILYSETAEKLKKTEKDFGVFSQSCPKCGVRCSSDTMFCLSCGETLSRQIDWSKMPPPVPKYGPPPISIIGKPRIWLIIAIFFLFIISFGLAVLYLIFFSR